MSRTLLVALPESDVVAKCNSAKVNVSAIEPLSSGGTRLVCASVSGAEQMRKSFKKHLINGEVTRQKHRPTTPLW
jgi:hypothetical protein